MGDWHRSRSLDLDGIMRKAMHDLARQVPLPDPDRVLSRPRAILAARGRARRRRAMVAMAGVAAAFLLGVMTWQLQSRDPLAGDADPPDIAVSMAAIDDQKADLAPAGLAPMEEAARQVAFPLHGPRWVPEGAVLADVAVEQPLGDESVTQVVMRFQGPGSGRLELRQAGPLDKRPLTESPPEHWLDGIDIDQAGGLEWFKEGILFQVRGNWDDAAARRFVQSLQPLSFPGEHWHSGEDAPVQATPLMGDSETLADDGVSEPAR